jgi:hypothetical protein
MTLVRRTYPLDELVLLRRATNGSPAHACRVGQA